MKAYDLYELAARNLRESILRNSLTTAGIAVGVASLLAMVSLGVGLQQLAGSRLSRSGLFDTIAVSVQRDQNRPGGDAGGRDPSTDEKNDAPPRVLDEAARREIEKLPSVIEVQPELRFPAEVGFAERLIVTSVGGLAPSARDNESLETLQGKYFSGSSAHEAIVRDQFAKRLDSQNPNSVIGKELVLRFAERQKIKEEEPAGTASDAGDKDDAYSFSVVRREEKLRIVGILDKEPFGGMRNSSRASVFIPTQLAEDLNILQAFDVASSARAGGTGKTYTTLMVRLSDPSQVQAAEDAVKKMGFRGFSILDASDGLRRFFTILDLFLGIFGSLALAVASLGIINTLVMAVLERRREIGILKAIGASDSDIEKLFFAEAGTMGLVGGILGVLIGEGIGLAINFATGMYLQRRNLPPEMVWAAPAWLVFSAIAFAIVVSMLAGLYPARRAAKLDPVQALRYE